ncbi:hypothetical protein FJV76_32215 [Mesorhizobium sp. WSM4303]|uniref:hypothetical protein n=1 Tax=unclassified Mesorhizobium TaxID=325217 RepID=UPI00115E1423|nr:MULTISPECIES: hypothetical protein [unclassified Mesorhizobium]TRC85955.1 hypothetical protein FJV77_31460 [Mesorhizobium sp. WSM4306]TRC92967.1 hypothetical protein FJV76_32215 [Mesorhizobium sp. WSM4303]
MTMAQKFDIRDDSSHEVRLRPAESRQPVTASLAGPFEVTAEERKGSSMREALMTGLLVIYPAFAALAAIVAGLFLTGASGT